jgi:hypothetical protein
MAVAAVVAVVVADMAVATAIVADMAVETVEVTEADKATRSSPTIPSRNRGV